MQQLFDHDMRGTKLYQKLWYNGSLFELNIPALLDTNWFAKGVVHIASVRRAQG